MLSENIKNRVIAEKDLNKALEILKPYKDEKWEKQIIEHLQNITPKEGNSIEDFSYTRKIKDI